MRRLRSSATRPTRSPPPRHFAPPPPENRNSLLPASAPQRVPPRRASRPIVPSPVRSGRIPGKLANVPLDGDLGKLLARLGVGYAYGRRAGRGRPVSKFAELVVSPAVRRATGCHAARVESAGADGGEGVPAQNQHRRSAVGRRATAQLTVTVVAPAICRSAGRPTARGVSEPGAGSREGVSS
jgi:hypothetical protein